ncbi:hypothetical protein [Mycobacterium sp. NAZ190054]|uniref:hypothetical protein n=1 Tax=Mycobacterium sp. NAZ190054 TaxID=1747766 RepID=UPI000794BB90|nr:hypothetical protein [Mycobacterium sp. NAZ190054]KWX58778.1 hypothetical protein ASJ79_09930 [Mycobacterium sp. NAZ190054]
MRLVYLLVAPVAMSTGIAIAPPAVADCTSAGGTTICSQGTVRGSDTGDGPSGSGPYVPYPCDLNYYDCNEWWNVDFDADIDVDPGPRPPGPPDIGRPGRPDFGNPGRPGGGGGRGGGGRR